MKANISDFPRPSPLLNVCDGRCISDQLHHWADGKAASCRPDGVGKGKVISLTVKGIQVFQAGLWGTKSSPCYGLFAA